MTKNKVITFLSGAGKMLLECFNFFTLICKLKDVFLKDLK